MASFPRPGELQTLPFLILSEALLLHLQVHPTLAPPRLAAGPYRRILQQDPTAGPPQIPGEQRQGMEAPPENARYPKRGSSGAQAEGSCSLPRSHRRILFIFALGKGILELESQARAQQMWLGFPAGSSHFRKGRLGQRVLRTQWECHNIYLTAAAGTACGRKRGGQGSQPPKKCTQLGRGDAFTAQGQQPGVDTVALTQVGSP